MIEAAKEGHVGVVKLLVRHGGLVCQMNRFRKTAFDWADLNGHKVGVVWGCERMYYILCVCSGC